MKKKRRIIMVKITFMGAGSTVFARNVLGDCMCTPALCDAEIAPVSYTHLDVYKRQGWNGP